MPPAADPQDRRRAWRDSRTDRFDRALLWTSCLMFVCVGPLNAPLPEHAPAVETVETVVLQP